MSKKLSVKLLLIVLGYWTFYASAEELVLNSEEQHYLKEHPVINMCVDPDWLPYEKLDSQGRHIGLVAEYMSLLQSRLNVKFRTISSKNWEETQTLYRDGFCDIVSALNKTPEREKYLNFTPPYIRSPAVIVLNESNEKVNKLADLKGKTLGMVKGYVYDTKLRQDYPDIKIVYLPNMEAALQKVSLGEIGATLGPLFLSFALAQDINNLKIMGDAEYQDELRIGIRKTDAILTSLLAKAVLNLSPKDHTEVRKSWSVVRKQLK